MKTATVAWQRQNLPDRDVEAIFPAEKRIVSPLGRYFSFDCLRDAPGIEKTRLALLNPLHHRLCRRKRPDDQLVAAISEG
jgi:hypothetical protein